MGRYELDVTVPLTPEDAFRLWTDPGRYPQWQVGIMRTAEATGPADVVGTVLHLEVGSGIKRTTRVMVSEPPHRYTVFEEGMRHRNHTEARFDPTAEGTRIQVTYDLEVQLGPVSGIAERVTRSSTLKSGRRELDAFAELATRPLAEPEAGALYTVDGWAAFRVVKVLGVDEDVVHLALMPGSAKTRPVDLSEILDTESRLDDPLSLRPLTPPVRRVASILIAGQPSLALDGGVGVPHLAMTIGAFTDARPEAAGSAPIRPEEAEEVVGWRAANGSVLGRDFETTIVPLVSVKEGARYAIAKLLHVQIRGVHVRLYSDRFDIPPDTLNPWSLRLDRYDAPNFSYGHTPMSRPTFAQTEPAYQRLAMCSVEELDGYRMWKEARGGFF